MKKLVRLVVLLVLIALVGAVWFYRRYVRLQHHELGPGVHATLGGGGNSLIVRDGGQTLLVDPKFPPGSSWLRKWMSKNGGLATIVVDTHYHYDHTQGNPDHKGARFVAHRVVPDLMRSRDGKWWAKHTDAIPTQLVDDRATLVVGAKQVSLVHPPPAHTHGDLWAVVKSGDKEIVATGDLVFHTFYPFFDLGPGGANVKGLARAVRTMASAHPDAVFIPGHGPLASAADLNDYADYIEHLDREVESARAKGLSEDDAVKTIDTARWRRSPLPSLHDNDLCWATAKNNIRSVYRLQAGTGDAAHPPCSLWR